MIERLNQFTENGKLVTEYTKDGITISHRVEEPVYEREVIHIPSIEEQILSETQYQTALLEMTMMGAI